MARVNNRSIGVVARVRPLVAAFAVLVGSCWAVGQNISAALPGNNVEAPVQTGGNAVRNLVVTGGSTVIATPTMRVPAAPSGSLPPPPASIATLPAGNLDAPITRAPDQSQDLGTFNIVIVPGATLAGNAPALAAFNRAADQWKVRISSPITVTVNADLASLGTGIIGSTSSVILQAGYNTIRNQLVAGAAADPDDQIVAFTPTAAQFTAFLPSGKTLSGNMLGSKANLKAMGFTGLDTSFGVSDGNITFSTNFSFDYDNSNGVTAGTMDFETVASHEIGHLLGFISDVDSLDGGAATVSPYALDLHRFRNQAGLKPTSNATYTTTARGLINNDDEVWSDIDNEYRMSTGVSTGDGRQASHWKADELTGLHIGMMDPTLSFGQVQQITDADWRSMDLMGYDILMPEPGAISLLALGCLVLARRSRR